METVVVERTRVRRRYEKKGKGEGRGLAGERAFVGPFAVCAFNSLYLFFVPTNKTHTNLDGNHGYGRIEVREEKERRKERRKERGRNETNTDVMRKFPTT